MEYLPSVDWYRDKKTATKTSILLFVLFVTRPLLFVKVCFSQVLRRQMHFDLEQLLNKFRTCFRFLNTSSCE